jgi:hypothetical protein
MAFMLRACLIALLLSRICLAQDAGVVRLKWTDAWRLIEGKQVSVVLAGGGSRKGIVTSVDSGFIVLEKGTPARINRTRSRRSSSSNTRGTEGASASS